MSHPGHWQPPSISLPPVRSLLSASEERIDAALQNLHTIYCPLRLPTSIAQERPKSASSALKLVDSGYASEDERDDGDVKETEHALEALRADDFERDFALHWLTGLMVRAEELEFSSEETRERIVEDAASLLASFTDPGEEDEPEAMTRNFSFPTSLASEKTIDVFLNDAPLSTTDHTDVGLQSWGASIILSGLMCASPARFGLDKLGDGLSIIELGAGTGLVSLTLAALQAHISKTASSIIATDYHPAVLENLRSNISANFPGLPTPPVQTMLLDWSQFSVPVKPVDILIAADAVYAPEHAVLLRNCATRLLTPDGVFWLIVTVRTHGKFEGIADTVEAAFADQKAPKSVDNKVLRILKTEWVEKRRGIGRGDETGYRLHQIGWAE
ncbi:hypothetical protein K504DRAFT_456750 [Pleomassaria siparia CBS 279.74]|uniref:S-adenosyl-L-methionine-dependent methyltransferase n=1 Tax=Pleomassaria siparia CBS 279.74 TaxID=1314801 RepID=A0A6G1KPF3_9PLEO|nr:hypothetical protein K504DRAFT_456750 [Pleomassaria siparia CBS 279.74]